MIKLLGMKTYDSSRYELLQLINNSIAKGQVGRIINEPVSIYLF